jgi:hypothetical protein
MANSFKYLLNPSRIYESVFKKVPRIANYPRPIIQYNEKRWTYYDIASDIKRLLSNDTKTCIIKGYFQSDQYFPSIFLLFLSNDLIFVFGFIINNVFLSIFKSNGLFLFYLFFNEI